VSARFHDYPAGLAVALLGLAHALRRPSAQVRQLRPLVNAADEHIQIHHAYPTVETTKIVLDGNSAQDSLTTTKDNSPRQSWRIPCNITRKRKVSFERLSLSLTVLTVMSMDTTARWLRSFGYVSLQEALSLLFYTSTKCNTALFILNFYVSIRTELHSHADPRSSR
jgi:hypothetical protein